jgi:glutathione S-transferase
MAGEQKTAAYAAINPMHRVPALDDDGFVIWESNAILAYLGEREQRCWPNERRDRAEALRWMFFEAKYLADSVGPLWFFGSAMPAHGLVVGETLPDGTPLAERTSRARQDLVHPLTVVNALFSERAWVLGDELALADCSLGTTLEALAASGFDLSRYSSVSAYVARVRARETWRAFDQTGDPARSRTTLS